MNITNDIKPVTYLKSRAAALLNQINETRRPVIITQNGEAKGVFIDSDSYQRMKDTINLMKLIILSENDIDKNKIIEQDELFNKIDKKVKRLKNE